MAAAASTGRCQSSVDVGCARVMDVSLKVDRMAEVIAGWAEGVSAYGDACKGGFMCGDRKTGKVKSVTLWSSREGLEASEASGAMQAVVGPYEEMMQVPPTRSFWDVRVVVDGS